MYQMLPSPLIDLDGDDHAKLFERASWGSLGVHQPLLDRARAFYADLEEVVDPDRLLYIAGYDRRTPFLLELEAPGKFTYGETRGRRARAARAWPARGREDVLGGRGHGDLPKNDEVLDAISDLLQRGETSVLATELPVTPSYSQTAARTPEVEAVPAEAERLLAKAKQRRRATGEPDLTPEEEARLENSSPTSTSGRVTEQGEAAGTPTEEADGAPAKTERPAITIEIAWGDVTQIEADVYAVGHYQGVLPQNAELALDCAVSGIPEGCDPVRSRLVITRHTRRGILRGALGDVDYFPWSERKARPASSPAWDAPACSTTARSYACPRALPLPEGAAGRPHGVRRPHRFRCRHALRP